MMKILVGYDGSPSADNALLDLRRAGLPRDADAVVVSVADVLMAPEPANYEVAVHALTSRRLTSSLLHAERRIARSRSLGVQGCLSDRQGTIRQSFPVVVLVQLLRRRAFSNSSPGLLQPWVYIEKDLKH